MSLFSATYPSAITSAISAVTESTRFPRLFDSRNSTKNQENSPDRESRTPNTGSGDFIRELQAEDPTATPAEIRQRYKDHIRFRTEFKDDAVESEMIAILGEWLVTVVPD